MHGRMADMPAGVRLDDAEGQHDRTSLGIAVLATTLAA
jgi:hypothetical protein